VNLKNPESYHVEASARNLHLMRGAVSHLAASPVDGNVQATLDLTRNAVYLRSLRLTASSKGSTDYVLNIAGQLTNFDRPRCYCQGRRRPSSHGADHRICIHARRHSQP
jgi:hypothetical protein